MARCILPAPHPQPPTKENNNVRICGRMARKERKCFCKGSRGRVSWRVNPSSGSSSPWLPVNLSVADSLPPFYPSQNLSKMVMIDVAKCVIFHIPTLAPTSGSLSVPKKKRKQDCHLVSVHHIPPSEGEEKKILRSNNTQYFPFSARAYNV